MVWTSSDEEISDMSDSDNKENSPLDQRLHSRMTAAEANELFLTGKRHLFCQNIEEAVECLADCCVAYTELYGQFNSKCAEPLFSYGQALLELSRREPCLQQPPGTDGNVDRLISLSAGDTEGDTSESVNADERSNKQEVKELYTVCEERDAGNRDTAADVASKEGGDAYVKAEKIEEKKPDAGKISAEDAKLNVEDAEEPVEKQGGKQAAEGGPKFNDESNEVGTYEKPESTKEEKKETDEISTGGDTGNISTGDVQKCSTEIDGKEVNESNEDDDETSSESSTVVVPDLQLAWEMVDLARVIWEKEQDDESKLMVAECRMVLGEIALESDRYEDGLKELNECLAIQKSLLPACDRRIAQCYYQIGLAFDLGKRYVEAHDAFTASLNVLKLRREELMEKDMTSSNNLNATEITDLDSIIADVEQRIQDALDSNQEMASSSKLEELHEEKEEKENGEPVVTHDISHLVRRSLKRDLADSQDEETEMDVKRVKEDMNGVENKANEDMNRIENNANEDMNCVENKANEDMNGFEHTANEDVNGVENKANDVASN